MKKVLFRLLLLAIVAGAAWYGYNFFQQMPQRQVTVATARVRRGDVIVRTYARGELRAVRSATLTAPNLFGTVQVTRMAALGALAREKDLVVEFDDSELQSRLEEKQLELDQIDEQIKKSQADLAIRDNQDQVELLRTRYSVRRADLEVKRNELLSAIDAKKNLLTLDESKRRLKQLESDIKSRREQAQAELAVLQERRNKSVLELNREKARLLQVKLLSPMTGLVAIRQNRSSGFFVPGMQIPDIREGDQVQPGMPVADVLDLSELEVIARVGELDRANLREEQDVVMRLDALPDVKLNGKIKGMSAMATASVFANDPAKKFDVLFSVDMAQLLRALGAKPEQIRRIQETAEQNRKKPVVGMPSIASMMAGGGMPGGGMPGGGGGVSGGGMPGGGQAGGPPQMVAFGPGGPAQGMGGAMAAMGGLTPDQQKKIREITRTVTGGKNMQEMTDQERAAAGKKIQEELKKAGINVPPAALAMMGGGRGGAGGFPAGFGMGSQQFTAKDIEKADLPAPPEETSQLEVLLRPGMLTDVEIIVEKIPNCLNLPAQAIFEKDRKQLVYVKAGSKWEERPVKIGKRSEAAVVIEQGVKEGEVVAMSDPTVRPGDKKKKGKDSEGSSSGGAMGSLPGGK